MITPNWSRWCWEPCPNRKNGSIQSSVWMVLEAWDCGANPRPDGANLMFASKRKQGRNNYDAKKNNRGSAPDFRGFAESQTVIGQCRPCVLQCVSYWIPRGAAALGHVFSHCVVVTRAWIQGRKQTETPRDMSLETRLHKNNIIYFLCRQKALVFLMGTTWACTFFFKPSDVFMSALFCFTMIVSLLFNKRKRKEREKKNLWG